MDCLEKNHKSRKIACGHRLQVARVLICHHFKNKNIDIESILDNTLAKYDYDTETVIEKIRAKVGYIDRGPIICAKCSYLPPFCYGRDGKECGN